MTPDEFVAKFEAVAESSGGISRLRELVLELAVRGRLLEQLREDEPISTLLDEVAIERADSIRKGETSKTLSFAAIEDSEAPFPVPVTWRWIRWGAVTLSTNAGWSPQCESSRRVLLGWGILKVSAVSWGAFDPEENKALPADVLPREEHAVREGDFLMSRANTAELVGRSVVVEGKHQRLMLSDKIVRCEFSRHVDRRYINYFNRTNVARDHYRTRASGTSDSMKNISRDVILSVPIPLPPLAEQKRIVAKVDQLMALCDDLEARQAKKRETAVRLNRAALDALTTAEGPEEIAASFLRIAENFETLIDRAEKVDELREMIRQLAITGRLVRQDPGEEPVGKLLAAINVARGGYQPRQESIVDGEAVRLPDLPAGWSWALASDAATEGTVITYGIIKPVWVTAGVPTVRVKDIQDGKLVLGDIAHCTEERASRFSKTRLSPEDLVVAKDGATLGKTAVVPASLSGGNVTQHVLRFSIDSRLSREYVRLVVDAPHGQRWMKGETRGVALPGVNVEDFRRMPLPIPPVSEQKRIVAKVDQLMALCDSLEAALRRAEGTAQKLAEAVVAEIVA